MIYNERNNDYAYYEGYWNENKFEGEGKLILKDLTLQHGLFKENKLEGEGLVIYGEKNG